MNMADFATPSPKSPKVESQLEVFTKQLFGRSRIDSIKVGTCVTCGNKATDFKDDLSRKEYTISGMCQTCQDGAFTTT